MITDWALFQFAPVNVRTAGFTVPSVGSELLTEIETAVPAAGLEFKVTENVAVPPSAVGDRLTVRRRVTTVPDSDVVMGPVGDSPMAGGGGVPDWKVDGVPISKPLVAVPCTI